MNNGEWINTLSNEEKAKVLDEEWGNIDRTWEEWLNEEHKLTGHERLTNKGYAISAEDDIYVCYTNGMYVLHIYKHLLPAIQTKGSQVIEKGDCDFLFECADKIRKELGWV